MIITKLRLQEEHPMAGTSVSWPLPYCDLNVDSSAGDNGYILKAAVGIGPPDFNAIVDGFDITGIPVMDSVPDKREISLRIGFNTGAGKSVAKLRSDLYKYISRSVIVSLMDDSKIIAQTKGFVQKFETLHFSNQPEVQITILCKSGEFSSPESVPIPFDLLEVTNPVISYHEGDAPAGLHLKFKYIAVANGTGFTISEYGKLWYDGATINNQFSLAFEFLTNDEITIDTHPGEKSILLLRSSTTYDIAGYLDGSPIWPKLYPGVNTFEWDLDTSWMEWMEASYTPRYWGV